MKIFKSGIENYCFSVVFGKGRRKFVSFECVGYPESYGLFYCEDDDLADAIMKRKDFGTTITLFEDDEPKAEETVKTYAAVYEDVKRTQEANKILVNNYGVDKEQLTSKADALRIAEELNISFPSL